MIRHCVFTIIFVYYIMYYITRFNIIYEIKTRIPRPVGGDEWFSK